MLRISGSDVRPGHRGELRVLVAARRTGLGQLRAYLAADIIRRWSQLSGLAPTVIDLLPDSAGELRAVCAELNIHPPRYTLTPPVTADQLAGQFADGIREPVFDVVIRVTLDAGDAGDAGDAAAEPDAAAEASGLARGWIEVAGWAAATDEVPGRSLRERLGPGEEPLSVRLNLMRHGYGQAIGRGREPGEAAKTLARWRELVAAWARSPSGPMSRRYGEAISAAVADDLDTAAALRELAALADDPDVADGVKFETFAAADLLFGLDLARDVGR